MGAAPSSLASSSSAGEDVGKFRLTADQKAQQQVLSNIFQRLLRKNNLVDLAKTVGSQQECRNLILVLSSLLDKEFQTLRFPDKAAKITTVSFTEAESYLALQNQQDRLDVCKKIATFLVRFVVLVAALTASITVPTGMPSPLKAIEQIPYPALDPLPNFKSLNENALSMLVATGFAKKIAEDTYKMGAGGDAVYINTRGFMYREGEKSTLLGVVFGFKDVDNTKGTTPAYSGQSNMGAQQQGQQRPAAMSLAPFSQAQRYKFAAEEQLEMERKKLEAASELKQKQEREQYEAEKRKLEGQVEQQRLRLEQLAEHKKFGQDLLLAQAKAQPQVPFGQALGAPPTVQVQGQQPPVTKTNIVPFSGPRTRTRRNRRRVGGQVPGAMIPYADQRPTQQAISLTPASIPPANPALADYIVVQLYDLMQCPSGPSACTPLVVFYMDDQGHTWDKDYAESDTLGPLRVLESTPFADRVQRQGFAAVKSTPTPIELKRVVAEQNDTSKQSGTNIRTPYNVSSNTYTELQGIAKDLVSDDVKMYGPAVQRAFLLAGGMQKEESQTASVLTEFCKDPWVGSSVTSIPAFSLLEALYQDTLLDNVGPDSQGARNMRDFVGKMEGIDAWVKKKKSSTGQNQQQTPLRFSDYTVGALPSSLGDFCSSSGSGAQRIQNEEQKKLLLSSYRDLRVLYNRHIQSVVQFLSTLFVVDKDFWTALSAPIGVGPDPVFKLNPAFLTHSTGSMRKLLERCEVARTMLADHYVAVETLYRKTIQGFADIRMSKVVTPANIQGTPAKVGGGRRKTRRVARKGRKN